MNPFARLTPLPAGARGERGYQNSADARQHAIDAPDVRSFAILQCGAEFAWVAPIETYTARSLACLVAGVKLIETVKKQ